MTLYNEDRHGTTAKTPRSDAGQDPTETLFIAHGEIVFSLDLTLHSLPWQAPPQRDGLRRSRDVSAIFGCRAGCSGLHPETGVECTPVPVPRGLEPTAQLDGHPVGAEAEPPAGRPVTVGGAGRAALFSRGDFVDWAAILWERITCK